MTKVSEMTNSDCAGIIQRCGVMKSRERATEEIDKSSGDFGRQSETVGM